MAEARSEPFDALACSLRESGFVEQASRLEKALHGTWTTSSERIGELGRAVLEIRRGLAAVTPEQERLFKDCLRQVHRVWPGFGFLTGIWHRWLS